MEAICRGCGHETTCRQGIGDTIGWAARDPKTDVPKVALVCASFGMITYPVVLLRMVMQDSVYEADRERARQESSAPVECLQRGYMDGGALQYSLKGPFGYYHYLSISAILTNCCGNLLSPSCGIRA